MYDRDVAYKSAELVLLSRQGVPCLIGNTGVGKTDMIKQIAQKHNKNLIIINTSVMNADDLAGYPYLDKESNKMKWGIPDWFPTEPNHMIFLDEFNRADKQVINALMPLLLSGELHHGAKLPKDCWIAVAFNPDSDDYDMVNSFDDLAISSRLVKIIVNNDSKSWANWAENTLNSNKIKYKTDLINHMESFIKNNDVKVDIQQLPNNRSFAKAIGVIDYVLSNSLCSYFNTDVVLNTLKGILGVGYVQDNKTFFIDILNANDKSTFEYLKAIIDGEFYNEDEIENAVEDCIKTSQKESRLTEEDIVNIREHLLKDRSLRKYNRIIMTSLDFNKQLIDIDTHKLSTKMVTDYIDVEEFDRLWNINVED